MKQFFILFFLMIGLTLSCFADEFVVQDLTESDFDLSMQKNPIKNINGELCALIKITSDISGLNFPDKDITDIKTKDGEYWIYVSAGKKFLKVTKSGFASLEYSIPFRLESGKVYKMKLSSKSGMAVDMNQNLVNLGFTFNTEDVIIIRQNAQNKSMGLTAQYKLPQGKYQFKFVKKGYKDQELMIDLIQDENRDIVMEEGNSFTKMKLPGIVMIKTNPSGAEIFIDQQKVGVTPYSGEVLAGNHTISIQKEFYTSYNGNIDLKEGETQDLPLITLKENFGFLSVNSNVESASVYVDENEIGKTPLDKKMITSGFHKINTDFH